MMSGVIYDLATVMDEEGWDPLSVGLPKIDFHDVYLKPCMKNSTDRACTREGM